MEKNGTDGIKTEKDADTNAIRPARTGTLYGEHHLPQLGQRDDRDPKPQAPTRGMRHGASGGYPGTRQAGRDTWSDVHKISVQFVRCDSWKRGSAAPFTGDQRADGTVQSAAPLLSQSLLDIRPAVTPDRRFYAPVKLAEGRRSPFALQHPSAGPSGQGSPGS